MEAVKTNIQARIASGATALPPALTKPIGRPAGTGYTCAADIKTPMDFMRVLHRDRPGVRCIAQIQEPGAFRQMFLYPNQLTDKVLRRFEGQNDVYVGMNLMLNKARESANIKRFTALYTDLDCYKIGLSPEETYEKLCKEYFFIKVPAPSLTVFSGRGVQLIWLINEDPRAISRWTAAEKFLCEQLKDLGSDPKATDPARILRLPFTCNSKGGEVTVKEFIDCSYTLHEIIKGYEIPYGAPKKQKREKTEPIYPYGTATEKQRQAARSISEQLGIPVPNFDNYDETFAFVGRGLDKLEQTKENKPSYRRAFSARDAIMDAATSYTKAVHNDRLAKIVEDLMILATLRKGTDCGREQILFLIRYFVAEATKDFDYALKICMEVNETFDCPLTQKEAIEATRSAEKHLAKGRLYKYRNKTLSKKLNITAEEEKHLHYLTASAFAERKKEKDRIRKKNDYHNKLVEEGLTTVSEKIKKKVMALVELSAQGLSRDAICALLEISTATFYRYKKVAEEMAANKDAEAPADATRQNDALAAAVPQNKAEVAEDPIAALLAEGWTLVDDGFDPFKTEAQQADANDFVIPDDAASSSVSLAPVSLIKDEEQKGELPCIFSFSFFLRDYYKTNPRRGFRLSLNHLCLEKRGNSLPFTTSVYEKEGRGDHLWKRETTKNSGPGNSWRGSACEQEGGWWRKFAQKPGSGDRRGRSAAQTRHSGIFPRGPAQVAESLWLEMPGGASHRSRGSSAEPLGALDFGWGLRSLSVAGSQDGPPGGWGRLLSVSCAGFSIGGVLVARQVGAVAPALCVAPSIEEGVPSLWSMADAGAWDRMAGAPMPLSRLEAGRCWNALCFPFWLVSPSRGMGAKGMSTGGYANFSPLPQSNFLHGKTGTDVLIFGKVCYNNSTMWSEGG